MIEKVLFLTHNSYFKINDESLLINVKVSKFFIFSEDPIAATNKGLPSFVVPYGIILTLSDWEAIVLK